MLYKLKNLGISAVIGVLIAVAESKSFLGAMHSQHDPVSGIQLALVSAFSAMLAFIGFHLTGSFKDDPRKSVKGRVLTVRLISIAFLMIPVWFFASSLAADRQEREWAAYTSSRLYQLDLEFVADPENLAGMQGRTIQEERLSRPVTADPHFGELFFAAFVLGMLNLAVEMFRIPSPITQAERLEEMYKSRGKKAAETRAKNKERKLKLVKGGKVA